MWSWVLNDEIWHLVITISMIALIGGFGFLLYNMFTSSSSSINCPLGMESIYFGKEWFCYETIQDESIKFFKYSE